MLRRIIFHSDVPPQYRSTFIHYYLDIGWFGVLSGSAAGFLGIYLTRLGASSFQIGLLGASGAVISLLVAMPAGYWLNHRPVGKAVFWTSVAQRFFYLLWIPLPWMLNASGQIWAMIIFSLLMSIPATALGVGFNALFAASVPAEWRAPVAGIRNAVLSLTFIAASLGSGYILNHVAFPSGYQIVFSIGAFGALMSSFHLYFIHPIPSSSAPVRDRNTTQGLQQPLLGRNLRSVIRADVWKTSFGPILIVMLLFTLAQSLALPLFPLYFVRILELSDAQIGAGTAIFYLAHLIGSTQLARITRKIGHHKVTAFGSMAMCLYPLILGFSKSPPTYFILQVIGGFVWSMVAGAQANYLLDNIPDDDRPAYLSWFSVIANASILVGSLGGPLLSNWMGIKLALIIFGILRLFGGFAILKWGRGGKEFSSLDSPF